MEKVIILEDTKEIEKLNVIGFNISKGIYIKKDLRFYNKIMIVNNVVVNVECNSESCNEMIKDMILNDNYDFGGLLGILKE